MADKKTVKVYRDGDSREFDVDTWKQLPDHKYGWKQKADEPKEVTEMKNSQKGDAGKSSNEGQGEKPLNAADLAAKIYEAETAEAVDALVPDGETRKTVLDAVEKRKGQLEQQ